MSKIKQLFSDQSRVFEDYHLHDDALIKTETIPGKKSLELIRAQEKYESNNVLYPKDIPLAFDLAKGSIVQDVDGNRFIDFTSICGIFNLGHNNSFILDRLHSTDGKISQSVDFPTQVRIDLLKSLMECMPSSLEGKCKVNFCGPSGSDAVEAALKLARINQKRHTILAFEGGYHGMTMGALSVTSSLHHRVVTPLIPGVHFLPYCDTYRCATGHHPREAVMTHLNQFKDIFENPNSGIDKPAAIIVEPVQGEGGTNIPQPGWLEGIVRIAHENDVLVIFDEVQTGFFRTGRFLSSEHTEAVPDIITLSKGLGGIGFPISLIIFKKELDKWGPGTHLGTFRGSQLAMAASLFALQFVKKYQLGDYVEALGRKILERLNGIKTSSKYIGDVRGVGLMFGIEYVKEKRSKQPYPDMAKRVRKKCYENGLLTEIGGYFGNVVRLMPPLITTERIAENGLRILEKANKLAEDLR